MKIPDIEGMDEIERRAILEKLDRDHPGRHLSSLAGGSLAGRATRDRPDVPIWDYPDYLKAHPEVDPAELNAIRYPVIFFGAEESTIDSLVEHVSVDSTQPGFLDMSESVVALWRHLYDSGIVQWNSDLRAVEHVQPLEAYGEAVRQWTRMLRSSR